MDDRSGGPDDAVSSHPKLGEIVENTQVPTTSK
jgi:hypothetical protein